MWRNDSPIGLFSRLPVISDDVGMIDVDRRRRTLYRDVNSPTVSVGNPFINSGGHFDVRMNGGP
jgi:hypothetical protein